MTAALITVTQKASTLALYPATEIWRPYQPRQINWWKDRLVRSSDPPTLCALYSISYSTLCGILCVSHSLPVLSFMCLKCCLFNNTCPFVCSTFLAWHCLRFWFCLMYFEFTTFLILTDPSWFWLHFCFTLPVAWSTHKAEFIQSQHPFYSFWANLVILNVLTQNIYNLGLFKGNLWFIHAFFHLIITWVTTALLVRNIETILLNF